MANSIAVCYVNESGGNLHCKRVSWDDYLKLRSGFRVILIRVYWQQQPEPAPPNTVDAATHDGYKIDRFTEALMVRTVDLPGPDNATDITFDDDGVTGAVRPWDNKFVSDAIASVVNAAVGFPGYSFSNSNHDEVLLSAKTLTDATPVT